MEGNCSNSISMEEPSNNPSNLVNKFEGYKMCQNSASLGLTHDVRISLMGGNGLKSKVASDFDKENPQDNSKASILDNQIDAILKNTVFSDKAITRFKESASLANNELTNKELQTNEKTSKDYINGTDTYKQPITEDNCKETHNTFDKCTMQAILNNGLENLIKGKFLESLMNQNRNLSETNLLGNEKEFTRPNDFMKIERVNFHKSQDFAVKRPRYDVNDDNNDSSNKKVFETNLETPSKHLAYKQSAKKIQNEIPFNQFLDEQTKKRQACKNFKTSKDKKEIRRNFIERSQFNKRNSSDNANGSFDFGNKLNKSCSIKKNSSNFSGDNFTSGYGNNSDASRVEEEQIKKYNDLIKVLPFISCMDWESINPLIHKTSPLHNSSMTSIAYWFMMCNQYFPRWSKDCMLELLNKVFNEKSLVKGTKHQKSQNQNTAGAEANIQLTKRSDIGRNNSKALKNKNDYLVKSIEEYAKHTQDSPDYIDMIKNLQWDKINEVSNQINTELNQINDSKTLQPYNTETLNEDHYKFSDDVRICMFRSLAYKMVHQQLYPTTDEEVTKTLSSVSETKENSNETDESKNNKNETVQNDPIQSEPNPSISEKEDRFEKLRKEYLQPMLVLSNMVGRPEISNGVTFPINQNLQSENKTDAIQNELSENPEHNITTSLLNKTEETICVQPQANLEPDLKFIDYELMLDSYSNIFLENHTKIKEEIPKIFQDEKNPKEKLEHLLMGRKLTLDNMIHNLQDDITILKEENCTFKNQIEQRIGESYTRDKYFENAYCINTILNDVHCGFEEEKVFLQHLEEKQQNALGDITNTGIATNNQENNNGIQSQSEVQNTGVINQKESSGLQSNEPKRAEDFLCLVCNNGDYGDDNLIVFCSGCNICVHQKCYEISQIPDGDWYCNLCINFGPSGKYLRCPLCTRRGGAMRECGQRSNDKFWEKLNPGYYNSHEGVESDVKPHLDANINNNNCKGKCSIAKSDITTQVNQDNANFEENLFYDFYKIPKQFTEEELRNEVKPKYAWCHLSCAYWMEAFLIDVGSEFAADQNATVKPILKIVGLRDIDRARFKLTCGVCGTKNTGACLQCCKAQCHAAFHPECAR